MSRIRTVKPEFWTSEQILNLSLNARLFFIGMWNFCDDRGIHPASLRTIKANVFPADDIEVGPLINELLKENLIEAYSVDTKDYWRVTGWKHQKIDKPTYKHPLPDGEVNRKNDPSHAARSNTDVIHANFAAFEAELEDDNSDLFQ